MESQTRPSAGRPEADLRERINSIGLTLAGIESDMHMIEARLFGERPMELRKVEPDNETPPLDRQIERLADRLGTLAQQTGSTRERIG